MPEHHYKIGEHLYMTNYSNSENGKLVEVKVTALKKQSSDPSRGGEAPKYNVKIIGTKTQKTNVSELSLNQEKPPQFANYLKNGGRRRTVKRKAQKKRSTRSN